MIYGRYNVFFFLMAYDISTLTYGLQQNQQTWLDKNMSVGVVQLRTNFTLLLEGTPRLAKVNIELNNSSIQIYSSLTVWLGNMRMMRMDQNLITP